MELIVTVEDDIVIGPELSRQICPKSLEIRRRCEDRAIIASKVVRVENGIFTSGCNERYNSA
jgi:hypothetical protein